jgi:hypothetical protein
MATLRSRLTRLEAGRGIDWAEYERLEEACALESARRLEALAAAGRSGNEVSEVQGQRLLREAIAWANAQDSLGRPAPRPPISASSASPVTGTPEASPTPVHFQDDGPDDG